MSPEQARGLSAGRNADIWAFGCVLYETLTGRRAFAGATINDTLAAVLKSEPDWAALSPLPAPLETLVRRCLEKEPRRRLRDVSDARIWLDESQGASVNDQQRTQSRPARLKALIVPGVVAAAFAAGGAFVTFRQAAATKDSSPTLRFEITPPPAAPLGMGITGTNIALSSDGSQLVYQGMVGDGYQLMVRRLDAIEATPVPGSDLARNPFFSPDGKRIGFVADGILKTVALDSGGQTAVCPIGGLALARWSDDGTIVFSDGTGVFWVPERGGTPELLARPDPAKGEGNFFGLDTLPGGGVLVGVTARAGSGNHPRCLGTRAWWTRAESGARRKQRDCGVRRRRARLSRSQGADRPAFRCRAHATVRAAGRHRTGWHECRRHWRGP